MVGGAQEGLERGWGFPAPSQPLLPFVSQLLPNHLTHLNHHHTQTPSTTSPAPPSLISTCIPVWSLHECLHLPAKVRYLARCPDYFTKLVHTSTRDVPATATTFQHCKGQAGTAKAPDQSDEGVMRLDAGCRQTCVRYDKHLTQSCPTGMHPARRPKAGPDPQTAPRLLCPAPPFHRAAAVFGYLAAGCSSIGYLKVAPSWWGLHLSTLACSHENRSGSGVPPRAISALGRRNGESGMTRGLLQGQQMSTWLWDGLFRGLTWLCKEPACDDTVAFFPTTTTVRRLGLEVSVATL